MTARLHKNQRRLSWHFLRRRADARASDIRGWQTDSRPRGTPKGGPLTGPTTPVPPPSLAKAAALRRLEALGISAETGIYVRRRGKWDARYDVIAEDERYGEVDA